MNVIVINQSRKKSFRRTKRIVSALLPAINNRTNLGNIPKRVLMQLVKNIKENTTKGTSIQLFFEEREGFRGFKCLEFGKRSMHLRDFVLVNSSFDLDLLAAGIVV